MSGVAVDRTLIERLVRSALQEQMRGARPAAPSVAPKLVVNVSARHAHVTQEDLERVRAIFAAGGV